MSFITFAYIPLLDLLGYEGEGFDYLEYNAPSDAPTNLFGE